MRNDEFRVCTHCVMDTSDPNIEFDEDGVCNHCKEADAALSAWREQIEADVASRTIDEIKRSGRGKRYDCIIGLSGGADSSYLAFKAVEQGLRPLVLHLDNGWDSELAVQNIENIVRKLDLDLHTHVIDWPEFRDLQLSYIKASVIDIEVPTDHAIAALEYREAVRRGIGYILTGWNTATESILPRAWFHPKSDLKNLKEINKAHGSIPLKTYPTMSFYRQRYYERVKGISSVPLLDLMRYEKKEALDELQDQLGWRPYTGKHGESVFTRFYQGYILPRKFGVDKRKAHLSSLICAGQTSRAQALDALQLPPLSEEEAKDEKVFVTKKLRLSEDEFDRYMQQSPRAHEEYPSDFTRIERLVGIKRTILRLSG